MLLVIGIVGTTVAPWQLFFQQSYVIDKRITPRFMKYEKADLWIGIAIVVRRRRRADGRHRRRVRGHPGAGNFTDSAGLAHGIAAYAGHVAGALFAVALLDASVIGAFAVSLSIGLRDRRRARHEALAAPRRRAGQGVLRPVRRADLRRRRDRAHPRLPARADHRGRPGPGGRAAAGRHGVPAHALQRQGRARPLGQPAKTNAFTSARDRGADHAVDRADRVGDVPGDHGHARSSRSWRAARPSRSTAVGWLRGSGHARAIRRRGRSGPSDADDSDGSCKGRPDVVADAAARRAGSRRRSAAPAGSASSRCAATWRSRWSWSSSRSRADAPWHTRVP